MNVLERVNIDSDKQSILIFENTYYSLFLYLLCDSNWTQRDFLIFGDRISYDTLTRLKQHANVLDESYRFMPRPMPKIHKSPLAYFSRKQQQKRLFTQYDVCIGNPREINNWLIDIKRIQIEDGTSTRNELTFGGKKRGVFDIFFESLLLKEPRKIDRIDTFVIAAAVAPLAKFEGKVETVNFFSLWQNKSPAEQAAILDVLNVDASQFNAINKQFSVLFTQPWSESPSYDYDEASKVEGYRKLVETLGVAPSQLVIKPHPREETDYSQYFPEATVLKASFPSELMPILNVHVDKVITLNSTAGSCFDGFCNEVIYARAPDYFKFPKKLADHINNMKL